MDRDAETTATIQRRSMMKPPKEAKHFSFERNRKMASELADIVRLAIINAKLLGIGFQKAIEDKWLSKA
jgi:NTP pyrophosphatase (non-canonical NTP hydrolase)